MAKAGKQIETGPPVVEIEGFSMSNPGNGWRRCRSEEGGCDGFIKGAAGKKACPNCGHVKAKGERQLSFPQVGVSNEVALFFILAQGGVAKAIKAVEAVAADPVLDFVCQCGGSKEAAAKLNLIAQKIGQ